MMSLLKSKLNNVFYENIQASNRNKILDAQFNKSQVYIDQIDNEKNDLSEKLEEKEVYITNIEQQMQELQNQFDIQQQNMQKIKLENESMQQQNQNLKIKLNNSLTQHQCEINNLKNNLLSNQQSMQKMERDNKNLGKKIYDLEQDQVLKENIYQQGYKQLFDKNKENERKLANSIKVANEFKKIIEKQELQQQNKTMEIQQIGEKNQQLKERLKETVEQLNNISIQLFNKDNSQNPLQFNQSPILKEQYRDNDSNYEKVLIFDKNEQEKFDSDQLNFDIDQVQDEQKQKQQKLKTPFINLSIDSNKCDIKHENNGKLNLVSPNYENYKSKQEKKILQINLDMEKDFQKVRSQINDLNQWNNDL